MSKQLWVFIYFLLYFAGAAQDGPLNLSFKHLSPNEGLSQGTNAYVYKDSRGFVWISSLDGLNRFDGIQVRVYKPIPDDDRSLLGRNITSQFFEDTLGNLWFTTNEAINCYQRASDNFKSFQLKDSLGQRLQADYYAFHLDAERLWLRVGLGAMGQLHLFNIFSQEDSLSVPIDGHRSQVIIDEKGIEKQVISSMLFNQPGIEIIDLEDGQKSVYNLSSIPETANEAIFSRNILVENDTLIWIGTVNGLLAFNPQNGIIQDYIPPYFKDEFLSVIWSVAALNDDFLLVSTLAGGILLFSKQLGAFVQQFGYDKTNKNSLHNTVRELYIDEQSNIWVSSYEGGIAYANVHKQKFQYIPNNAGQRIYNIVEDIDKTSIWVGFDDEIRLYKKGRFSKSYYSYFTGGIFSDQLNTPISEPVYQIMQDSSTGIKVLTGGNLLTYEASKDRFELAGTFFGKAFCYQLKNKTNLAATNDGLVVLSNPPQEHQAFKALGDYQDGYYTHIFEDQKSRLFLSENAANLLVFTLKDSVYQLLTTINETGYCYHFFEQTNVGIIWVATSTGLLKINAKDLTYERLNLKEHGLPNEVFYAVFPDQNEGLWLSSNKGIIHYQPDKSSFHRYQIADGLQGNEFFPNVATQTQDGIIWMGGINGINVFNPNEIQLNTLQPEIQFTNLLINDEISTDSIYIGERTSLKLLYDQNTISLEFVALEYSDAPNNQFKYQLLGDGYNAPNEWIDNKNRGFIRFPNLPPGDYVLNLKAANSDGYWSKKVKSLAIAIAPPFWKTWWFYLFCLLLVSTIMYAIFQYRLQQALKVERLRVKISSDLHDDVGGLLSGLAMQSEILEMTAKDVEKPKLRRIAELSRSAMSRMRDTVWAIDARKDEFEHLLDRMREHAEETLTPKEFQFSIKTNNINPKLKLPTDVRQNLYLLYKEAVTNVAKHSNGNQVTVVMEQQLTKILMTIHDNGKVANKDYKTTGLGCANMKMRAKQLGGKLTISVQNGYTVTLEY